MELHDFLLQLFGLVGSKAKLADVVTAQFLRVVVSQFRLSCVRAQYCMGGKGAGQAAWNHIISQLQAQVVPVRGWEVKTDLNIFDAINLDNVISVCQHLWMMDTVSSVCVWTTQK